MELKERAWLEFYIIKGRYFKLPDTTLVGSKTKGQAKEDIIRAEAIAKKMDPAFRLTKYIHGLFDERVFFDEKEREVRKDEKRISDDALSE